MGSITACVCSTTEKGQKIPLYLIAKTDIKGNSISSGFDAKTFYSQQVLNKAQKKIKIIHQQINFFKQVFTVANHQWFFTKKPDYKTTEFYQQLNKKIISPLSKAEDRVIIRAFLEDYLSKKNNFFKNIIIFLDQWKEGNELILDSEKNNFYIKPLLFIKTTATSEKKNNSNKSLHLPEVVFQFTNKWRILLSINNITLQKSTQSFVINKQTYYQGNFQSLKAAKLTIKKIIRLNSYHKE